METNLCRCSAYLNQCNPLSHKSQLDESQHSSNWEYLPTFFQPPFCILLAVCMDQCRPPPWKQATRQISDYCFHF